MLVKKYRVIKINLMLSKAAVALLCLFFCVGCQSQKETHNSDQGGSPESLSMTARAQIKDGEQWRIVENNLTWDPKETAIIICDMWDKHWCDSATARVARMAPMVNQMVSLAREKGMTIVHAPSSTTDFYQGHPARRKALEVPKVEAPIPLSYWFDPDSTREAALPIDDSDEGCDCPGNKPSNVWTRQIETIEVLDEDIISDSGQEIFNYFEKEKINNVILCGVHANMCVLGRTFGIRGQVKLDRNVVLVRDLTDAMYNPEMPPYVSHQEGTELVIEHIEKYWAPSVEWRDVVY